MTCPRTRQNTTQMNNHISIRRDWIFALIALANSLVALDTSAADLDRLADELRNLNKQAELTSKTKDYVATEKLRLNRLALIQSLPNEVPEDHELHKWVDGGKALREVNGVGIATSLVNKNLAANPGLIDRCQYKQAYQRLLAAHSLFSPDDDFAFGDLAIRMFEVVQQAKHVLAGSSNPTSSQFIASDQELLQHIRDAEQRDPCTPLAVAIRHFLTKTDPREAFLTADVRPTLRERQADLLAMSHPITELNAGIDPRAYNWPVLPIHAPAEFLKGDSLRHILQDLDLTVPLIADAPIIQPQLTEKLADLQTFPPDYAIPGVVLDLLDSNGEPAQLLYGRVFVTQVRDSKGRRRPALLYLSQEKTKPEWKKLFLNILLHEGTDNDDSESGTSSLQRIIGAESPRFAFKLSNHRFAVYDYPILKTKQLLASKVHILRIQDVFALEGIEFMPSRNDPRFLVKLAPKRSDLGPIGSSIAVEHNMRLHAENNDRTQHPLLQLFFNGTEATTPVIQGLVVVSNDDGTDSEPTWWVTEEEQRILKTTGGDIIRIVSPENNPREASFELDVDGVGVTFPLSWQAVPKEVIRSCFAANEPLRILRDAGYDNDDAADLLAGFWSGKVTRPKGKLLEFLKQKQASRIGPQEAGTDTLVDSRKGTIYSPPAYLLKEYGLRYIKDSRGNIVLNQELVFDKDKTASEETEQYAYAMRTGDGSGDILIPQIYGWNNYVEMKQNLVREHLAKVASLHPCLPAMKVLCREASTPLINPSLNAPSYLGDNFEVVGGNSVASELTKFGGTPYEDIRNGQFVHPRAYVTPESLRAVSGIPVSASIVSVLNRLCCAYQQFWCELDSTKEWCVEHRRFLEGGKCKSCDERSASLKQNELTPTYNTTQMQTVFDFISPPESFAAAEAPVRNWTQWKLKAEFYGGLEPAKTKERILTATMVASARLFAEHRRLHASVIAYNDAIEVIKYGLPHARRSSFEASDAVYDVFTRVPNSRDAQALVGHIENRAKKQRVEMLLQIELAGVLYAAGFTQSAGRIWNHVATTGEIYLSPMIVEAKNFLAAYGLAAGDQLERAADAIDELIRFSRASARDAKLDSDWKAAVAGEQQKNERVGALLAELSEIGIITRASSEEARIRQRNIVAELHQSLKKVSFSDWVRVQLALLKAGRRPTANGLAVSALLATPLKLTHDLAFERMPLEDVFSEASVAYRRLRDGAPDFKLNDLPAAALALLAGAYSVDRGEIGVAKSAFASAYRAFLAISNSSAGETKQEVAEKLLAELNAYWCVILMEAVIGEVEGVESLGIDFSEGLQIRLLSWSRRWFAAGLRGRLASSQQEFFMETLRQIDRAARMSSAGREPQWFYPDYWSALGGPIPDPYLALFFEERPVDEIVADSSEIKNLLEQLAEMEQSGEKDDEANEKIVSTKQRIDELRSRDQIAIQRVFDKTVDAMNNPKNLEVRGDIVRMGFPGN